MGIPQAPETEHLAEHLAIPDAQAQNTCLVMGSMMFSLREKTTIVFRMLHWYKRSRETAIQTPPQTYVLEKCPYSTNACAPYIANTSAAITRVPTTGRLPGYSYSISISTSLLQNSMRSSSFQILFRNPLPQPPNDAKHLLIMIPEPRFGICVWCR